MVRVPVALRGRRAFSVRSRRRLPAIAVAAAAAGLTMPPVSSVLRSIWPTVAGEDGAQDGLRPRRGAAGGDLRRRPAARRRARRRRSGRGGRRRGGPGCRRDVRRSRGSRPCVRPARPRSGTAPGSARCPPSACGRSRSSALWLGLGFGAVEIAVPAFAETARATGRSPGSRSRASRPARSSAASLAGLRPSSDERRRIIVGTFGPRRVDGAAARGRRRSGRWRCCCSAPGCRSRRSSPRSTARSAGSRPPGSVAEAFSWFGTSVSIGIAGGSVAGGWLIDSHGWRAAVLLAIVFLGLGAVVDSPSALDARTARAERVEPRVSQGRDPQYDATGGRRAPR